jgi:sterol desaturase/sphingolipid hydroxylase (fatty acid hydroxylase superfamily)
VSIAGVETDGFWIDYIGLISYVGFGAICTVAELVRPARKLRYRKELPLDAVAFLVYQLAVFPAAVWVSDPVTGFVHLPSAVLGVSLPLRVLALYLFADFGSYWMHRLMHTRHAWRVHRWHHSSTRLYWLSGVRATIPQQILFNLPAAIALPILAGAPLWVFLAITVEGVARNHWMHMNVAWRSNWLERVFVTPRYHHIHHSADAALHDGNYGALFTIWDRLFGTYLDPDVTKPKTFGTGEKKRDPVLLMIGI